MSTSELVKLCLKFDKFTRIIALKKFQQNLTSSQDSIVFKQNLTSSQDLIFFKQNLILFQAIFDTFTCRLFQGLDPERFFQAKFDKFTRLYFFSSKFF